MAKVSSNQDGLRASDSDEYNNEKYDAENNGRRNSTTMVQGRKMSRIGPVTIGPVQEVDSYGKLVEMEAENAIKYRTCSWQKVWRSVSLVIDDSNALCKYELQAFLSDGDRSLSSILLPETC
jgi:hypothetical protein